MNEIQKGSVAMADVDEVLDVQAAAAYLKLNDQTLRRFAREGQVPAFRLGGRWRFKRSVLDAWAEARHEGGQNGANGATTVLVVDDEQAILDPVSRVLESEGFSVAMALDGSDALEQIQRQIPDLVLLDLTMNGMDGPTTLREIRSRWRDLPVIVLTGYPDSVLMQQALKFSPLILLAKPADPEKILIAVNHALGLRKNGTSQ